MRHRILIVFLFLGFFVGSIYAHKDSDSTMVKVDTIAESSTFNIQKSLCEQNWSRIFTTFGLRMALRIVTVDILKNNIQEWRPNHENRKSFPSRHAVWAYGVGGKVAYTLGPHNPWWAIGAQTAANIVSFQRVISKNHYPGDVLAGAALGIGTDLLAYEMGNWIFGRKLLFPNWNRLENDNISCLSMSTGASFPINEYWGEYKLGTALYSNLRFSLPTSDKISVVSNLNLSTAPVKNNGQCIFMLNALSIGVGPRYHYKIGGPFAIGGVAEIGMTWYITENDTFMRNLINKKLALNGRLASLGSITMTRKLAIGLEVGYSLSPLEMNSVTHSHSNLYVAFSTQVRFL